MEKEEIYSTTNAKNVAGNSKTKEDRISSIKRYGANISGKDKRSMILKTSTTKARKRSGLF
jgi:hypothetical protein